MEKTDQQHPHFQSKLSYHEKVPVNEQTLHSLKAQNEGVSVFSRHQHFDPDDPKNLTGMQKMAKTSTSNFKFGSFQDEDYNKKSIRYKPPMDSLPINPKDTYQWIGDQQDMSRLSKGAKKTPIFNIKTQQSFFQQGAELYVPIHNPEFLEQRKESIDTFKQMVLNVHRKSPENQHLAEYTNRLEQRLRFVRHKRHSMANQYPKNEDILMNSIGSAVSPKDVPMLHSHTMRNQDKKVKFSFGKRSVSIDPAVANKIGRPIKSHAYENFATLQQPLNVLKHNDSTNLVKQFVNETKHLSREDISYTKIAEAIEQDLQVAHEAPIQSESFHFESSILKMKRDSPGLSPPMSPFSPGTNMGLEATNQTQSIQHLAADHITYLDRSDNLNRSSSPKFSYTNLSSQNMPNHSHYQKTQFSFGVVQNDQINANKLSKNKFKVSQSKSYLLIESPQSSVTDFKPLGLNNQSQTLDPIKEEIDKINFKECFSKIRRPVNTKIIGGGPIYPIAAQHEKRIVDLDDSCMQHKKTFSERLQRVWKESQKVSQPYLFDKQLIESASQNNLPESRNQGFRVGVPLVRDQLLQEAQEYKLDEVYKQSYFCRKRASGFKNGALNLVRGDHGGFVNLGKQNDRLDLSELLKKYDNIAKTRDDYTSSFRDSFKPVVEYINDEERTYEQERIKLEELQHENEKQIQKEYIESLHLTMTADNISPQQSPPSRSPNYSVAPKLQKSPGMTAQSPAIKTTGNSPLNTRAFGGFDDGADSLKSKLLPMPSNKASLAF